MTESIQLLDCLSLKEEDEVVSKSPKKSLQTRGEKARKKKWQDRASECKSRKDLMELQFEEI